MLTAPVLALRGLEKDYRGLRPLRIRELEVGASEIVCVSGPDGAAAAVLTDLLTATTLPEKGEVVVSGRSTRDIEGQEDWLAFLDQFGLVSDRVVLLDGLTVGQNLAVPLTLDLDPMAEAVRASVAELAAAVGLPLDVLDSPLHHQPASVRTRVRLGRAIALRPSILVLEHPTVDLSADEARSLAATLRQVASARSLSMLVVSSDADFCSAAATRRLTWKAADGTMTEAVGWRRWFGG